MSGHDEPADFYPIPLDQPFILCFYPFARLVEGASSRDVSMMEPPPLKGRAVAGGNLTRVARRPRPGEDVPSGLGRRRGSARRH